MAITQIGSLGAAQSKTAGTPPVNNLTIRGASVGDIVFVACAVDNTTTTDAQSSDVGAPSDSKGNTYTKVAEFTNGQGAVDAGATVALYKSKITTALVNNVDSITGNFNASRAAQAITCFSFSVGSGNDLEVVGTIQTLANDGVDPGSMAISGLSSAETLFIRVVAAESNSTSNMTGTNYQQWTGGASATTSGGGAASNMGVRGLSRILTGTSDTLDPTYVAADCASIYVALREFTPGVTGSLSKALPMLTSTLAGVVAVVGVATATLPALTLSAEGAGPGTPITGTLSKTLPMLTIMAGDPVQDVYYINTGSTAGGTGRTNATSGTDRAFASKNEADSVLSAVNWAALNKRAVVYCAGTTADVQTIFDNAWTGLTSDAFLPTFIGDATDPFTYDTSKYRIEIASGADPCLGLTHLRKARFFRIQFKNTVTANFGVPVVNGLFSSGSGDINVEFDSCIIWASIDASYTSTTACFQYAGPSGTQHKWTIKNCVLVLNHNSASGSIHGCVQATNTNGDVRYLNNTVYGGDHAYQSNGSALAINNIANGQRDGGFAADGSWHANSDYNISNVQSAGYYATPGSNSKTSTTVSFVNASLTATAADFHLALTDTAAVNSGTSLASYAGSAFNYDGDGDTRSGTWDIGADELIVSIGTLTATLPMLTSSASGVVAVQGTSSTSLPALTSSATGVVSVQGTLSRSLPALTSTASGVVAVAGTATPSLPALTLTGAGAAAVAGAGSGLLPALTSSAAGAVAIVGSATTTLPMLTLSASGGGPAGIAGDLSQSLPMLTATASGAVALTGSSAVSLPALVSASTGVVAITGTSDRALPMLTAAATATSTISGSAVLVLPALTSTASATSTIAGSLSRSLPMLTLAATGAVTVVGTSTRTLPMLTSSASGAVAIVGTLAKPLPMLTIVASSTASSTGNLSRALPMLTLSAGATSVIVGAGAGSWPVLTLASSVSVAVRGTLARTLPMLTIAATGIATNFGNLSRALPMLTISASATSTIAGAAAASWPILTLSASGVTPISGALDRVLPMLTLAGAGQGPGAPISGVLTATLPALTLVGAVTSDIAGSLARVLPMLTLSAFGSVAGIGALADVVVPTTGGHRWTVPVTGGTRWTIMTIGEQRYIVKTNKP